MKRPLFGVLSYVGRGISYCHSCGNRVLEGGQDPASLQDGRRLCAACRPAPAAPAPPVPLRRQTSTRLRVPPGPAARVRETTRIRKRNPLLVLVPAVAVVALAIGLAIAAVHAPEPEAASAPVAARAAPAVPPWPVPKAAAPSLDDVLGQIREIRQTDFLFARRDEVVALLREAAGCAGNRLEEVDLLAADYDRKFEEAASRLADFTRSEALRMAARQNYAEAIERLDGYPTAFRPARSAEPLRVLRQDLERRRAESTVRPPGPSPTPPAPAAPRRVRA